MEAARSFQTLDRTFDVRCEKLEYSVEQRSTNLSTSVRVNCDAQNLFWGSTNNL